MISTLVKVTTGIIATAAAAFVLTFTVGVDHPGPRPVLWTDVHLAAALTQVRLDAPVRPGDVAGVLTRDCPYLPDPIGLVQHQRAGTEAEANAVMSVLAQSRRC